MLYLVGKDIAIILDIANKIFYPSPPTFPMMHVDTTWKSQDIYKLREKPQKDARIELIILVVIYLIHPKHN